MYTEKSRRYVPLTRTHPTHSALLTTLNRIIIQLAFVCENKHNRLETWTQCAEWSQFAFQHSFGNLRTSTLVFCFCFYVTRCSASRWFVSSYYLCLDEWQLWLFINFVVVTSPRTAAPTAPPGVGEFIFFQSKNCNFCVLIHAYKSQICVIQFEQLWLRHQL